MANIENQSVSPETNHSVTFERRPAQGMEVSCDVVWISKEIGYGLFANEPIRAGQMVWRYRDETNKVFFPQEFQQHLDSLATDEERIQLLHHAYVDSYVGAPEHVVVTTDDGAFVNHSEQPNIGDHPTDIRNLNSYALRDIAIGEQLTESYNEYDEPAWLLALLKKYGFDISYYSPLDRK